jgi:hypothetical protein
MATVAALALAMLLFPTTLRAQDPTVPEHRVKAAFLYQFAGYVEWPPNSFAEPDSPVTIAVIGAEPVATELKQLVTGRTVRGRPVTVRAMKPGETLAGIHILFIGSAENARLAQIVQGAKQRPVLTVTEADGALGHGSMINFVIIDRRVRFEVALDAVEKSGLRLSSRLLAVAQQVKTGVQ